MHHNPCADGPKFPSEIQICLYMSLDDDTSDNFHIDLLIIERFYAICHLIQNGNAFSEKRVESNTVLISSVLLLLSFFLLISWNR
jgi:hypothetical protein